MKTKIMTLLIIVMALTACTQYSCPTYGNNYVYSPSKKKSPRSGSGGKRAKPVKRAEM